MFQKDKPAAFTYAMDNGNVDLVEGRILNVDDISVSIADNNVKGPPTVKYVPLENVLDVF